VDSTVVETNIHHPTDSRLVGDGVRVVSRLLRRAKKVLGEAVDLGQEVLRTRTRSVRRLTQQIHRIARRKGEEAAEEMKEAYAKLIKVAKASRAQAEKVSSALREQADDAAQHLTEQFEHFLPMVDRAIEQAKRRVIDGQAVPAAEKLLSLFEPHTQIIVRHKAGKPVEFGRKVCLDEVEGGIISRYEILRELDPDYEHVAASLEGHQERFGRAPYLLAGDRGCYSPKNEKLALEAGVKRIVLPKTGRLSPERQRHEKERWFRRGMCFRSGSEGRISVLKRRYGLNCCLNHGEEGFGRWVGWGILTANLATISRTVAARQAK
jgi:IS5 family transposase